MGIDRFYNIRKPNLRDLAEWVGDEMVLDETDNTCPVYKEHYRRGWKLDITRLVIALPSPNVKDFVWTWYSEMLVTERTLSILEDEGLTGFNPKPVTVKKIKRMGKDPKPVPPLWEMRITGKGGDADPVCGIKLKYKCEHCRFRLYTSFNEKGIIVDPRNWDGLDFFTVNGYARFIMVTEHVKEVVERHKLKGCRFLPPEEIWKHSHQGSDDNAIIEGKIY